MALNQMIAQGAQFNMPDPVAQYAKMQQLQAIQNQNSLAQYQLGSAQRGDMQQNALYARLQDPNFDQANPQHLASLSQFGTPGIQAMKAITEASNARQTGQKLEGENRGAQQREIDQIARNLSQNPTDENIQASKDIIQKSSFYSPEAKTKALAAFDRALKIPLTERGSYFGMQGATSGELKPTITPQNLGGTSQLVSTPAFGGKATVVPGSVGSNTMTPFQSGSLKVSQQQLGVAQGNQRLAQEKFNWEKANPNKTIKEVEQADGTIQFFGIDNRTGVATPVKLAGAPGPAMPGQGRPAVDGGIPLTGKKPPSATAEKTAVSEQQAAYNIGRVLTAAGQINEIGKKDPDSAQPGPTEALASSIGMSGTANLARNANRQIVQGAQRDALDALLYLATGAAYNKEQLQGQMDAYIPAFTDKSEAVAAKKARMANLIQSAKVRAGKAWTPEMDKAMTALTGSAAPAASSIRDQADAILRGGN